MLNTSSNAWLALKAKLLDGLYTLQIKYWNERLAKLIQRNAQLHGVILSESVCSRSAIQYKNVSWTSLPINWLKGVIVPPEYHFPVYADAPEIEAELITITDELKKIKRERYESDRFLTSLSIYLPTQYQLQVILGDNLYALIAKAAQCLLENQTEILQPHTLDAFLQQHQRILEHMQERVLRNLIMSDIVK